MAVKIRLTRMGARNDPFYRIVAMDSKKARDGKYIEQIGYYDPAAIPPAVKIDNEIALKWLSNGAQPTETVRALLKKAGVYESLEAQKADAKKTAAAVGNE